MAVKKNHKALLKQLKKQVRVLQKKEKQSRNQLRAALKKMRKLGRVYKSKLASKMRIMQSKIADAQASTYARVAADIERQMLKNIESKARSLRMAIDRVEKKHINKLAKSIAKKSKKAGGMNKKIKPVRAAKVKVKNGRKRSSKK